MKRKIIRVILFVSTVVTAIYLLARFLPVPKTVNSNEWFLLTRVENIVRRYSYVTSDGELLRGDSVLAGRLAIANNDNRKKLTGLNSDNWILEIDFEGTKSTFHRPDDIKALFEVFLYLKDRATDYDIVAIKLSPRRGDSIDQSPSPPVTVTQDEFAALYHSIQTEGKTDKEIAGELASTWLEENPYNRSMLEFEGEYAYREFLLTQWNDILLSPDGNFDIYSDFGDGTFFISLRQFKYGAYIISPANSPIVYTNETGYFYAAWDEDNNIWTAGEVTGITFYELTGIDTWVKRDEYVENDIPEPILKVVELEKNRKQR